MRLPFFNFLWLLASSTPHRLYLSSFLIMTLGKEREWWTSCTILSACIGLNESCLLVCGHLVNYLKQLNKNCFRQHQKLCILFCFLMTFGFHGEVKRQSQWFIHLCQRCSKGANFMRVRTMQRHWCWLHVQPDHQRWKRHQGSVERKRAFVRYLSLYRGVEVARCKSQSNSMWWRAIGLQNESSNWQEEGPWFGLPCAW